ncbi:MipA/OmpV family protein [Sphingobium sp. SCG-1]|uniref:MipA/OmpV family protein n=1 Tax=Sphingobium sp. SCG-1 TaxID=2072936 RepID=UPI000CD689C9|nr:MipA/OmpV family protein [Sphingobium sp. SCG-1]AUW59498.1 MipA/OmpV family protein [Sphingobium sp. SCG-1]
MTVSRFSAVVAATLLATSATTAFAQDADADHSRLTIGVGAAMVPSYEGSDDYVVTPAAAVNGKVHDFAFWSRGTALYVDAIPNTNPNGWDFQLGPYASVNLDRTGRIKDRRVKALGELDTAIELGGFAGIGKTGVITSAYDTLNFTVAYGKDVADAHDSYVITPTLQYFTPLSTKAFVTTGVSAEYVGKGYGRYYFDITPAASASTGGLLPAYSRAGQDSGFKNLTFNLGTGYSLSGDLRRGWTVFALGAYTKMLGDYKRSPVVSIAGDSDQWVAAVGIGYTF